jgi:type VI secretion system secreted protein VgrG
MWLPTEEVCDMAEKREILFTFKAASLPEDKFALVRMDGREAMSDLYQFSIDLVSADPDIDTGEIVNAPATLEIDRDGDISRFHGIVARFEQRDQGPEFVHYTALVVPRIYALNLTIQSQIFQDKNVKTIIEDVLKQNNLTPDEDFALKLTRDYAVREYVVQYQESDLTFIRRLMEHYGIFFFFEHGEKKEKLVIADSRDAYKPIPGGTEVPFRDARLVSPGGEAVGSFVFRHQIQPAKVKLKDYNYRKPALEVAAEAAAAAKGTGTVYEYGHHMKDPDEGGRLAQVRSEEHTCREKTFVGEGAVRGFRAGATFKLQDHFRAANNQEYLLVEVEHIGRQLGIVGAASGGRADRPSYTNRFQAIPAGVLFVPRRITPRPRIYGVMHAKVDAASSGRYAELDDQGRYKVKVPFDLSEAKDGKASRFIRMAQPYGGPAYGFHFPLHKGMEVLLTHLDGDPDRPVISAAVPNPDMASPVTQANQTQCVLLSSSNNEIRFEDQEGEEEIYVHGQKDWVVVIENDHEETIKHDQKNTIGNDRTEDVGQNEKISIGKNRQESVEGNETITIGGNRERSVTGGETITVEKDRKKSVQQAETASIGADYTLDVGKNVTITIKENRETTIGKGETLTVTETRQTEVKENDEAKVGKILAIEAGEQISLKSGDASIILYKNGNIEITGADITIKGSGKIDVKADGDLTLKGSNSKVN